MNENHCGATTATLSGEYVTPCHKIKNHEGQHEGQCLGSPCVWMDLRPVMKDMATIISELHADVEKWKSVALELARCGEAHPHKTYQWTQAKKRAETMDVPVQF